MTLKLLNKNIHSAKHWILCLFVWGLQASAAASPAELAFELEFTSEKIELGSKNQDAGIVDSTAQYRAQTYFKKQIERKCSDCKIQELKDKYGVRKYRVFPRPDWYFEITLDPGILEITSSRISNVAEIEPELQRLIWDTADSLKMTFDTAGHLNFGVESTFGQDTRLFRNFYIDFLNNVGLSEGILGYRDLINAPHPERLKEQQRLNLKELARDFDSSKHSIQDFAAQVQAKVYFDFAPGFPISRDGGDKSEKFQSANMTSIAEEKNPWPRLELRSIPMQRSARELRLLHQLFVARIEYLKKFSGHVAYDGARKINSSKAAMIEDFYRYVTESGLRWEDYRHWPERTYGFKTALKDFEKTIPRRGLSCKVVYH
ncbi:MAG: hypothetical protein ACK5P7_04110 [Bdellovibrio sp.]|jgi:hypothetical protein